MSVKGSVCAVMKIKACILKNLVILEFRIAWTVLVCKYKSEEPAFVPLGHNLTFKTIH